MCERHLKDEGILLWWLKQDTKGHGVTNIIQRRNFCWRARHGRGIHTENEQVGAGPSSWPQMGTGWPSHLSLGAGASPRRPGTCSGEQQEPAGTGRNQQPALPSFLMQFANGCEDVAKPEPGGCGMRSGSAAAQRSQPGQPGQRGTAATVTVTPWAQQSQRGHKAAVGK